MPTERAPSVNVTGKQASYIGNWLCNSELKQHVARDWLWRRVMTAYLNGTTIALRQLDEGQLDLLRTCFLRLNELTGGFGRAKATRKAAKRQLNKLEAWQARSAIDRLGDIA